MGKKAPDAFYDAAFDFVDQASIMHVCSAEPADYAGIAAVSLADVAMTPDTDFTKAAGDVSGRKVTVAAKNGVPVDVTGTATHVVLATVTGSVLRYVTTCTTAALTAGNTVNIPSWSIEIASPS